MEVICVKKRFYQKIKNVIKQITLLILFFKPDKYFNISNSVVPLNVILNLWSTSKRGSSIIQLHSSIIAEEAPSIQCKALLHSFSLVDAEMFRQVVTALMSSTCTLDPIPTSFILFYLCLFFKFFLSFLTQCLRRFI